MPTLKQSTRSHDDLYERYKQVQPAELRVGSRRSVRGVKGLEDQYKIREFGALDRANSVSSGQKLPGYEKSQVVGDD